MKRAAPFMLLAALSPLIGCDVNLTVGDSLRLTLPPARDAGVPRPDAGADASADASTRREAGPEGGVDASTDAALEFPRRITLDLATDFENPQYAGHGRGTRAAMVAYEPGGRVVRVFASTDSTESMALLSELTATSSVISACVRVAKEGFEIWLHHGETVYTGLQILSGERFVLNGQGNVLSHELKDRAPSACTVNPIGFFEVDSEQVYAFIEGDLRVLPLPLGGTGGGGVFLSAWQGDERVVVTRSSPAENVYELGLVPVDGSELVLEPVHQNFLAVALSPDAVMVWDQGPYPADTSDPAWIHLHRFDATLGESRSIASYPFGTELLTPRFTGHEQVAFRQTCFAPLDCELTVTGGPDTMDAGIFESITLSTDRHEIGGSSVWSSERGDSMGLFTTPYPVLFIVPPGTFK